MYIFLSLILLLFSATFATTVVHDAQQQDPLQEKWNRASAQAKTHGWNDYWVGYSIRKMMGENEYMLTGLHIHNNGRIQIGKDSVALEELIYGHKIMKPLHREDSKDSVKDEAARTLDELEHPGKNTRPKILKELAILAHYAPGPKDLEIINVELSFDFEGKPLVWLGTSDDAQSINLLQRYFKETRSVDVKENIVFVISAHQNTVAASPFLQELLSSKESDSVRCEAAAGIASQNTEQALQLLLNVIRGDRSEDVRAEALDGISEMTIPNARKVLIDLAEHSKDHDLRVEAISSLSNREAEVNLLKRLVLEDPDEEVREAALDMLLELKAIPFIIQVAKSHSSNETRSSAIDLLGESKDPAARQALIEIAKSQD